MPSQEPVFEIDATNGDEAYVVRIHGELDLAGGPALERALEEAERSQAERVFLDLEALTFIDAGGLHTIVQASRRSKRNGGRLQITRGGGRVAYMLRLTELDKTLPLIDASLVPQPEALVSA